MATDMRLADESELNKGSFHPWLLAAILVAIAPAMHTLATWDLDGRLAPQAFAIRHYSYLVVLVEVLVIGLAVKNDMSIQSALLALPKGALILIGLWVAFALAALFWHAEGMANATFILIRYVIHGLFLLALVHILRNSDGFEIRRWLAILSMGGLLYISLLVVFYFVVPDPEKFPWVLRMPSATNIRQIGNNIGILAVASIALLLAKGRSFPWRHATVFLLVFAFALWTGSRATLIGFVVGIVIGLLSVRSFSSYRNILLAACSALLGTAASLLAPLPDPAFGLFRLVNSSSEQVDSSSGRLELWGNTWQQIMQSPWVGHGAGRFRENMHFLYGIELNHPHNFVLQFIYDWGFLGGFVALLLLATLGWKILKVQDTNPVAQFAAITAFGAICITAMVDSPLFHPLPIVIALALIAPVFVTKQDVSVNGSPTTLSV